MFSYLNILLMNNKHGKLFVIEKSKGCKFMPKKAPEYVGGLTRYTP